MEFKIVPTEIAGCLIYSKAPFCDQRGEFIKSYDVSILGALKLSFNVAEVFYSRSKKNVIRGMHFQTPPHDHVKLVTCLTGHILDVVVDLRKDSPTFQKALGFEMKGFDGQSICIPRGCAHGFYSFHENTLVAYLVETGHAPAHDKGILWNSLNFSWPSKNPIVSERDSKFTQLAEYNSPF